LKWDYSSDSDLLNDVKSAKVLFHTHHAMCYAICTPQSLADDANATGSIALAMDNFPITVNFTSRYKKKDYHLCNELEEYFKLPCKDFNACNPLQWWVG
jgi:hypothetical protein